MKRIVIGMMAVLVLIAVFGVFRGPQAAIAQEEQQKGWLEGNVLTHDGNAANMHWDVHVLKDGKQVAAESPAPQLNGLYSIRDLRPGVYEIHVSRSIGNQGNRPQRIWGVVIKPGVRSTLNVRLHEGNDLEEIGQPVVATQPVIILSQELARLQKEIDALKSK